MMYIAIMPLAAGLILLLWPSAYGSFARGFGRSDKETRHTVPPVTTTSPA